MADRAVFLDRDGVLTSVVFRESTGDKGAPLTAADVRLESGATDAINLLHAQGWKVAVFSNQPDSAKGQAKIRDLILVHHKFVHLLDRSGAYVDDWRYCFHHPDGKGPLGVACSCRKPGPGMLLASASEMGVKLDESWAVGDSDIDIEAGQAAGCRTMLIENPATEYRRNGIIVPDSKSASVLEAATAIVIRTG